MVRDYIMKGICEASVAREVEIRQAAFECLVSIASMYYGVLELYMQTIFYLASNAVRGDEEAVPLQAVEFWSSICDEEIELLDYEMAQSSGETSYSQFIMKALPTLVLLLLETLLKQDEDQDDGIWNLAMAGRTCLCLVARTVGHYIVPLVTLFVEANIREAVS